MLEMSPVPDVVVNSAQAAEVVLKGTTAGAIEWSFVMAVLIPLMTIAVGSTIWIMSKIAEAKKDTQGQIDVLRKEHSDFRERVAREYVSRDALREVEDKVLDAINRLGDRLDRLVDQQRQPAKTP